MEQYRRSLDEVCNSVLSPPLGVSWDPHENRRLSAVFEVLRRMPDDDYRAMEQEKGESFEWFVPPHWSLAHVFEWYWAPKPRGTAHIQGACVIYLSPKLEQTAWDVVVATVAHELAHIALGHLRPSPEDLNAKEEAAWECVRRWGFEREAKKACAVLKWRESYEKSLAQKSLPGLQQS